LLRDGAIPPRERLDAEHVVKTLLATEPTLYQVKLIDADGRYRMLIRATGPSLNAEKIDGGEYYAWRASSMRPHTRLLFAIEVAGPEESGLREPMPAVALLFPVHAPNGKFRGAVVG